MILVYPNAYEKLLQKINYKSSVPTTSNMNDFEKWMEIQQKMLEHKYRMEQQQKIKNNLSNEISKNPPELKKLKMDLENQNRTTSTQTDEMVDESLKDESEDENEYDFYSPKTPSLKKIISPRGETPGLKKKHRNPMTVTTVFTPPGVSSANPPKMQTRSSSKNKVQNGKSIVK